MIERQRQDLIGRQPRAIFVDDSKAVRIAIQAKSEIGFATQNAFAYGFHALGIGLGAVPAKKWIDLVVKQNQPRASPGQQSVEIKATDGNGNVTTRHAQVTVTETATTSAGTDARRSKPDVKTP